MDREELTLYTPSASVGAITLMGYSLQEWVLITTIIYSVLMICRTTFRLYRDYKEYKVEGIVIKNEDNYK